MGGRFLVVFLALGLSVGASAEYARFAAGATQIEFRDPGDSARPIDVLLTYPVERASAKNPLRIPLSANLQLFADAPIAAEGVKHPLVVFSHGAGGNGSVYAWFGEYLASHGYRGRAGLPLPGQQLRLERALRAQPHLAAAARHQPGHLDAAPGPGLGPAHRCRAHRRGRPFAGRLHRALARRRRGRPGEVRGVPEGMEEPGDRAGLPARRR